MPVTSIIYQPATGQLMAAYRPIVFKVQATATGGGITPPFVVCDIYLADVYYKSMRITVPVSIADTYSVYQFDISDALREYMQADLATIDNNNILAASHSSAKVFCRFRASGIDGDGFTVEEPTVPIQATLNTPAVAGTGTLSNTFFAINSALQHEDNQNLALHLADYKQGEWAENAFPLTHRKRYFFCDNDSDHYPLIFTGDCTPINIILHYRLKGQTNFQVATAIDVNTCDQIIYNVDVTGNRLDIHMAFPLDAGQTVLVSYKKFVDPVWINVGEFTTQDFFFYVNGDDIAGEYFIRIIHFCTPCLSSDPRYEPFELDGSVVTLGWRGIHPYCVQQVFPDNVYVKLERRNLVFDSDYFPDNIDPITQHNYVVGDLYAMFFSDTALLNPVSVTQDSLRIYVMDDAFVTTSNYGTPVPGYETQSVATYVQDVNGTEVFLGSVHTSDQELTYDGYPTISKRVDTVRQHYPYPTKLLIGGNTGDKGMMDLQQYNTVTNIPTGVEKPNDIGDPDYESPGSDLMTCPNGPDITTVLYSGGMEVFYVKIYFGSTTYTTSYVADSYDGKNKYVLSVPKNTNTNVAVRARSFNTDRTTLKIKITYVDSGGAEQVAGFDFFYNIDFYVPQTFQNIISILVSEF